MSIASTAEPRPHPTAGSQLVRHWTPTDDPKAELVFVHGIAEHSGRHERVGSAFASAGIRVSAPDLVGFGASGGRRGDIDTWSTYLDQVEELMSEARSTGRPVVLGGQSMGGLIALEYALSRRPSPDLLVLFSPALEGGAAWQRTLAPMLKRILPRLRLPNALKGEQLASDPAVGEAYFTDPLVYGSSSVLLGAELFAAIDRVRGQVSRLDVPTYLVHGGLDTIVPARSTVALGEVPCVSRHLYPTLRHECMNEPEGAVIVGDAVEWVLASLEVHD